MQTSSSSRTPSRPLRINPYSSNSPDLGYPDRDRRPRRGARNLDRLGWGRFGFLPGWFGRARRDPDDVFYSGSHRLTYSGMGHGRTGSGSGGNGNGTNNSNNNNGLAGRTRRTPSSSRSRSSTILLKLVTPIRTPRRALFFLLAVLLTISMSSTIFHLHPGSFDDSRMARRAPEGRVRKTGAGVGGRFGGYKVRLETDEDDHDHDHDHEEREITPIHRHDGRNPGDKAQVQAQARTKTGNQEHVQVQEEVRYRLQEHAQQPHRGTADELKELDPDPDDPSEEDERDTRLELGGDDEDEQDVEVEQDLFEERSDISEQQRMDGISAGISDDPQVEDGDEEEDEDEEDILVLRWGAETGLRVLTEEDLYANSDETEVDSEADVDGDEETDLDPEGDEAFFDLEDEDESEEARQARIQVWKDQNRKENRIPLGDLIPVEDGVSLGEDEDDVEDGEQPDWYKEIMGEGDCRFESPVEAYQRALTRLRKAKLAAMGIKSVDDIVDRGDDERSDGDTAEDEEEITQEDLERFSHPSLASHTLPNLPGAHKYSPTGHLVISPDEDQAEHPIPQLLKLGERRWEEMIGRQSRTLNEAVDEYRRRYGRAPPKGFDVWWEFAQEKSLLLPDEYDRIHLDLAPFWALPRTEMRKRVRQAMDVKETFTLVVDNGTVSVEVLDMGGLDWGGTLPRAKDTASLIRPFAQHLPDMRAVFSIHDQPQIYVSATRRQSLIELGLRGEHTAHLNESDSSEIRWDRSCRRESNLRTPNKHEIDEKGSLVYDTLEANDMCKNPYLLDLHGFTVEKHGPSSHPKPRTNLMPLFGLAKTSINSDILVTPLDQFADAPGFDPPWRFKRSQRIAWRGSTTGISYMTKDTPWQKSHRFRLHNFAQNASEEETTFMVPDVGVEGGPLRMKRETGQVGELSDFFYDMKLAGEPLQCDEADGTCDQMEQEIEFADHQPAEELNDYKFLFDIDGNSWSGRFRRLMNTKSLVLKTGIFTEWFQPHLIPWFSYIPTRLDFSDLPLILSFLRGSPAAPDDGFDEVAEALANNGRCFTKKIFRVEDMQAYMFRLFLEYARLMAPTDDNVDFVFDPSMTDEGEIARINTEEFFAQDSKIWRQSDQDVADFEEETDETQENHMKS